MPWLSEYLHYPVKTYPTSQNAIGVISPDTASCACLLYFLLQENRFVPASAGIFFVLTDLLIRALGILYVYTVELRHDGK
jgi:hypothetical protein